MAERRMISKKITDTDAFLDMPLSTQALYFHFIQNADDDGFVGNPISIIRKIGANRNDYDLLLAKRFVINFESGICVIKHWRIHNYIQNDRYTQTTYLKEKNSLQLEENKTYSLKNSNVYILDTQDRLDKDNNIYTVFVNENEKCKNGTMSQNCPNDTNLQRDNINYNSLDSEFNSKHLQDENLIKETKVNTKKQEKLNEYSEIFDYWNSKKIIVHKEMSADIKTAIKNKLYLESANIKLAIDRYKQILEDTTYFFKYKWSLKDFLNRKDGITSFLDEGSKWINYKTFLENQSTYKTNNFNNTRKVVDTSKIDENGVIKL